MRTLISICLLLSLVLTTKLSYAECTEYKIIDHGDSVEAVCVGAPLSGADKKEYEKLKDQQEERDKRNAIIECNGSLPRINNYAGKLIYEQQTLNYNQHKIRCDELQVDLNMFLKSKPQKPQSRTDDSYDDLNGQIQTQNAETQAQMQRQQAEIQRQQMEIQRMQQQQKFDQIWKK